MAAANVIQDIGIIIYIDSYTSLEFMLVMSVGVR